MFSARSYLVLANLLVLCVLFPAASLYFWSKITELRDAQFRQTIESLRATTEAKGNSVVKSMSLSINEAVAGFDFSFINDLLQQVVEQDAELRSCLVRDIHGTAISHNDPARIGSQVSGPFDEKLLNLARSTTPLQPLVRVFYDTNNKMFVLSPVWNGADLWGLLRCEYALDNLNQEIETTQARWQSELISIRNSFIGFAILLFLVAVMLSLWLTGKLTSEIGILSKGVKRIADGDLEHTIQTRKLLLKEFVALAGAFNKMTGSLHDSYRRLDEQNASLEAAVKQRTRELEAINQELKAFSYSVSHDLRAPLRAINGLATALMEDYEDKLDDEGRMYLERILYSTRKMDDLISGMLVLSRATRSEIEKTNIDVSQMVNEIIEDIQSRGSDKPHKISVQADMQTYGDKKLVHIVFENLISNAWKYSSKKPMIYIEIGTLPDRPEVFYVKDEGAGFDMKYANKLFTPFQRLHKTEDFDGTGIGLATVSRIINRHAGKIWVESKPDEGATFYFRFVPG